MKLELIAIALVVHCAGCTYPSTRGVWTGRLTSVVLYDRHGHEYCVAAFDAVRGTRVPEPYLVGGIAYATLVDVNSRAIPFNVFGSSRQVQAKGVMKRDVIWSFDGTEALGSSAIVGRRTNYGGGLVVVVKPEDIRQRD